MRHSPPYGHHHHCHQVFVVRNQLQNQPHEVRNLTRFTTFSTAENLTLLSVSECEREERERESEKGKSTVTNSHVCGSSGKLLLSALHKIHPLPSPWMLLNMGWCQNMNFWVLVMDLRFFFNHFDVSRQCIFLSFNWFWWLKLLEIIIKKLKWILVILKWLPIIFFKNYQSHYQLINDKI